MNGDNLIQLDHGIRWRYTKSGPIELIKTIFRREGLAGFYRGWTAMTCRDVFPYGIYMLTYEQLTKTLANSEWILEKKRKSARNYSYAEISIPIVSGAVAGEMI